MATGKVSPIVQALADISHLDGEVRVHLTRRLWDWVPQLKRAWEVFYQVGLDLNPDERGILIYLNLRRRTFSIVADRGIAGHLPSDFWLIECQTLSEELIGTHPENAIARSVKRLGKTFESHFAGK